MILTNLKVQKEMWNEDIPKYRAEIKVHPSRAEAYQALSRAVEE